MGWVPTEADGVHPSRLRRCPGGQDSVGEPLGREGRTGFAEGAGAETQSPRELWSRSGSESHPELGHASQGLHPCTPGKDVTLEVPAAPPFWLATSGPPTLSSVGTPRLHAAGGERGGELKTTLD